MAKTSKTVMGSVANDTPVVTENTPSVPVVAVAASKPVKTLTNWESSILGSYLLKGGSLAPHGQRTIADNAWTIYQALIGGRKDGRVVAYLLATDGALPAEIDPGFGAVASGPARNDRGLTEWETSIVDRARKMGLPETVSDREAADKLWEVYQTLSGRDRSIMACVQTIAHFKKV